MYCDGCGSPFAAGAQYCRSCGKRILGVPTGAAALSEEASWQPTSAARTPGDGRVGRNINLLAGLWLANGILRLMGLASWLMFRRFFFDGGWGWPFGPWAPGLRSLIWGGIFSGGAFLTVFGVTHLLLAWGLYERQPWARTLGIVIGCLALIRIPFGTALGIYTLWVLVPEASAREYDDMVRGAGQMSAARYLA